MATEARLAGIFTPNIVPLDARRDQRARAAPLYRLVDRPRRARSVSQRLDGRVHAVHARGAPAHDRHHGRPGARARADSGRRRRSQHAGNDCRLRVLPFAGRARRGHRLAVLLQAQSRRPSTPTSRKSATTRRSTSRCTTFRCSPRRSTCRRCSGWPRSVPRSWPSRIRRATLPHMIRMIQAVRPLRPEFSFLTGWDAALMPMLLIGCDGGTNATSGIVPEITRKLYDLTMAQRIDEARELQYKLVTLFDTMLYSADFPEGFRAALQVARHRPRRKPSAVRRVTALEDGNDFRHAGLPAGRRRICRRAHRRLPHRRQESRSRASRPHRPRRPGRTQAARSGVRRLCRPCPLRGATGSASAGVL